MEAIVKRLKKEKQEYETSTYEDGKTDGYELATSLSYEDLQYIVHLQIDEHTDPSRLDCGFDDYFQEYLFNASVDDYRLFNPDMVYEEDGSLTKPFFNWLRGWQAGIVDFWKEVAVKI